MSLWEATRPQSFVTNYATIVGCGNSFDVSSIVPNTSTCCSFTANSTGTDKIVWKGWQTPNYSPDSRYDLIVAIGCRSMGTMYLTLEYSVNSGVNWTSIVASYGSTAARSLDVFTASIARTENPSSLWVRLGATTTHSRGRAKVFDVTIVGSYHEDFTDVIADPMDVADYAKRTGLGTDYFGTPYEPVGVTDVSGKQMNYSRRPGTFEIT
jgi:hypothetical protein